ncbi:protealysin inhibitor emfourin [Massilia sp. LXY-6]|uniref:protealysin inhibitor emfourin n=1 Tax=Massilia sp. LXY-6 TaxID=3379823 RepID=UPI003EDFB073
MKITAHASGGFAGRAERFELDTGRHRDGRAIESLLARLDFFGALPACPVGADLPRWEITADDGQRCRTVTLAADEVPSAGWQALIDHLRASR